MTATEFLQSYQQGQRYFSDLDVEYEEGFSNSCFADAVFEHCFLYVDFSNSDLTNAQFISCNIKEANFGSANLTNAKITKCLVESAWFAGATTMGLTFTENYYFGAILGQEDFVVLLQEQENNSKQTNKPSDPAT